MSLLEEVFLVRWVFGFLFKCITFCRRCPRCGKGKGWCFVCVFMLGIKRMIQLIFQTSLCLTDVGEEEQEQPTKGHIIEWEREYEKSIKLLIEMKIHNFFSITIICYYYCYDFTFGWFGQISLASRQEKNIRIKSGGNRKWHVFGIQFFFIENTK